MNTLQTLHLSGDYDRIIVVAHSLGTVVAYDTPRAYYSRINKTLPDCGNLGSDFDKVDRGTVDKSSARAKGREIIGRIAQLADAARRRIETGHPEPGDANLRAWLVTDFITLASPLTRRQPPGRPAHNVNAAGRSQRRIPPAPMMVMLE